MFLTARPKEPPLYFHRALHQGQGKRERPGGEGEEEGQRQREGKGGEEEAQSDRPDQEGEWRRQAAY